MFVGQFVDEEDSWSYYMATELEYPAEEELKHLKGIIFTGSRYSVNDEHSWLLPLKKKIQNTYANYPSVKMLGVCFGNQLLCTALGGEVERMTNLEGRPLWLCKDEVVPNANFFK
jgi:GMP synthase-like glutamine amidotransferase